MVDSIGLNKIHSIPKTRSTAYKKTEKSKQDQEQNKKGTKDKREEKKRIGLNVDELC
jgi:hypothetical protein